MRTETGQPKGTYFDKPGFHIATHCDGGAHPNYTKPFAISSSQNKTETFRVIFQCRAKPSAYKARTFSVTTYLLYFSLL